MASPLNRPLSALEHDALVFAVRAALALEPPEGKDTAELAVDTMLGVLPNVHTYRWVITAEDFRRDRQITL